MEPFLCADAFNHITPEPHSSLGQVHGCPFTGGETKPKVNYPVSQSEWVEKLGSEVHRRAPSWQELGRVVGAVGHGNCTSFCAGHTVGVRMCLPARITMGSFHSCYSALLMYKV